MLYYFRGLILLVNGITIEILDMVKKSLLWLCVIFCLAGCKFHTADKEENYYFANSFWGDDYFYCAPFFAYKDQADKDFLNILLFINFYNSQSQIRLFDNSEFHSFYALLYYQNFSKKFQFNAPYRLNPELIKRAIQLYAALENSISKNDTMKIRQYASEFNRVLNSLGIKNLSAPTNPMMLKLFKDNIEKEMGKQVASSKNILFPLYYYSKDSQNSFFSILYPLSEFKNNRNTNLTIPEIPNKISPYGKKLAVSEYDLTQIFIIYMQEKLVYHKWKQEYNQELLRNILSNLIHAQNILYKMELVAIQRFNATQENNTLKLLQENTIEKLHQLNPEYQFPTNATQCTKLLEEIINNYSENITEKSLHLFPLFSYSNSSEKFSLELLLFFRYKETAEYQRWSFLWRLFDFKSGKNGKSGHIFFIPFGKK